MFKEVKNKPFFLILLSASLIIWGVIIYQFFWGTSGDLEIEPITYQSFSKKQPTKTILYSANFLPSHQKLRNPFKPYHPPKKKPIVKKIKIEKKIKQEKKIKLPLPEIRYVGFLGDAKGSLAILATQGGNTQICSEGDSLAGVYITKIEERQITIQFSGEEYQLGIAE